MVLQMARPARNASSAIFWFRKRVPRDLQSLVGKTEEKVSLKTRDPVEAKIAHARVAGEVEARWQMLRRGVQRITHKQAVGIAGEFYRRLVLDNQDDPGPVDLVTRQVLWDQVAAGSPQVRVSASGQTEITDRLLARLRARHRPDVLQYLADQGLQVDAESLERIVVAVNDAMAQGREQLLRNAHGDYRPDVNADRFPQQQTTIAQEPPSSGRTAKDFDLVGIFERYSREAGHAPSTVKRWTPIIRAVAKEIPDIRNLTDIWCVGWKDRLLDAGLSPASINDAYLAALRSTCSWAKDNKLIAINPVSGIGVRVPKSKRTRPKGFTNDEAAKILAATLVPVTQRLTTEHLAARRWIPWVCAYSGARVGEIGQMRGQDIQCDDGIWVMWITPEAGSVKDGNARFVAVHQHLIDQGFIEFVRSVGAGPLFYNQRRGRGGADANPIYKKAGERVAAWVRSIGITDPALQPNHGWRHRFKTLARKYDMDPGARDYLQGQVPHNESEKYGDFEPSVLQREIAKLPRYEVGVGAMNEGNVDAEI